MVSAANGSLRGGTGPGPWPPGPCRVRWVTDSQATERCGPTRAESTCGGRLYRVTVFGSLRKRDGTGTGHGKRNNPIHTTVVITSIWMDWSGNQNGRAIGSSVPGCVDAGPEV
jgi:hypothetical protein